MLGALVLALPGGAWAQAPRIIEVASIKPSRSGSADSNLDSTPGGRLTATNITVRYLIRLAYGVEDYQIERAPAWVDRERYDIAVKGAGGKTANMEEERSMVRELLADRFQLTTHRETKQMPVYLLVVGKNGAKLTAHNDGSGTKTRKGCGHLAGTRVTTDVIAAMLSRQFERDVLNRTGLPGKYDFQLDWTPDAGPCPAVDSQGGSATPADAAGLPYIQTALQQQLGLRLEAAKGAAGVLVIDRVERPSEN
jgi:uncharacterized protein (TIGR03435 family)